jgi:hypothetical protein
MRVSDGETAHPPGEKGGGGSTRSRSRIPEHCVEYRVL